MKKLLGIVVLGLLWCNLSFASQVMWNYEKGYVRVEKLACGGEDWKD